MKKLILCFAGFVVATNCMVNSAFAVQEKTVEDGDEFTAEISAIDLNRIKVPGDRVRNIRGSLGEVIDPIIDGRTGDAFLKLPFPGHKPINIFVVTEKDFTYKGTLFPKSIPAEQIVLRNDKAAISSNNVEGVKSSRNSYENQIINLMKVMRDKKNTDGYQVKNQSKYVDLGDISMRRSSIYKGQNFVGEIFVLKNSTNKVISLEEKFFYKNGVRAVKIENADLLPGESTEIFIVS